MVVKTFLKIEGIGKTDKRAHSGTAGITITLDTTKTPAGIVVEYFGSEEMLTAMAGDLLYMLEERYPGVSKNAMMNYLKATNQLSEDGKTAHIQYKKSEGKEG